MNKDHKNEFYLLLLSLSSYKPTCTYVEAVVVPLI